MTLEKTMILAARHAGNGSAMESSAKLCLEDAMRQYDAGNLASAYARAMKSLAYSVGINHPDYREAFALTRLIPTPLRSPPLP